MNRSALLATFLVVLALIGFAGSANAVNGGEFAAVSSHSGITVQSDNSLQASLSFKLPEMTRQEIWHEGERFDRYRFVEDPIAGPEGWPEMPSMVRYVLIPPDCGVELKISNIRSHVETGANPFPRQPMQATDELDLDGVNAFLNYSAPIVRNPEAEAHEGFWPTEIAHLEKPAVMRGYRIVPIVINPVRYNSRTKELQFIDDFDIDLNYNTDANRVNVVRNPDRYRTSVAMQRMVNQSVVNPMRDEPSRDNGRRGGSVVYVLGTGDHWNPINEAIQPLVTWRRQMGYPTEVLRVQDIGTASTVKRALIAAYNEWDYPPEFVVLVGDGNFDFIVGWFDARNRAGNPYESDHPYSCLDGDDLWPDVAVGRLAFRDVNMLRGIVTKILTYERTPYLGEGDEVGWQNRAAFAATDTRSGQSSIDVLQWCEELVRSYGYNHTGEAYWAIQGGGGNIDPTNFFNTEFRAGISVLGYRGWTNFNGFTNAAVNNLRNGRMLPFIVLATCNTNDFAEVVWGDDYNYADRFIHYTGGGAIGAVGTGGATHTAYNNLIISGIFQNLFSWEIHNQGWAAILGKSQLLSHYQGRGDIEHHENGGDAWLTELMIYNLMGDPTTDVYTDVPHVVDVTAPERIGRGETYIEVSVLHDEDNSPALDASVCLYKADTFQLISKPDPDGRVIFNLEPEWTQDGSVMLTVTGHNLMPVIDTLRVLQAANFVGATGYEINDDNNGASSGNSDGIANQLETLELAVAITNLSQNHPDGALSVHATAGSPQVTIVQGDSQFDEVPAVDQTVTANFVVRIEGGFTSGEKAVIHLTSSVGNANYVSSIEIPVAGPKYTFAGLTWDGDPLGRGDAADLFLSIKNVGQVEGPELTATLLSATQTVGAVVPNGRFGALQVDATGRSVDEFTLSSHPFHLGGKPADLMLALESADGFLDTVKFRIATTAALPNEPFGPDNYGYICFDDLDEDWFATPVYNWVELNPAVNGHIEGATNLNLVDAREDDDKTVRIDLPFEFQYYGQNFDEVTICTNGWMATGDCSELTLFNNREIPAGMNAPGMIAPFWDELITTGNNSGVFTWFDEDSGRFFVEWSNMRRRGPANNNEAMETFQVVLHDPTMWPSFTGDGNIIFQYADVADEQSCFQAYDTPFATVGIVSPDLTTGLQYTYWHQATAGADALQDHRAIKFTTLVEFRQGDMQGHVYDLATGESLEGVQINTKFGFRAITDANGSFSIEDMLVDSTYTVRASKRFFNDSTQTDIVILEGETTYIEFGLAHPEFTPSTDSTDFIMLPDSIAQSTFNVQNTGNGQLTFTSKFVFAGDPGIAPGESTPFEPMRDDSDEPFRVLRRWSISDSLQDIAIQSVVYANDHWIVAGGASNADTIDYFYHLDNEGALITRIPQPLASRLGLRDMEYLDGILWATNSDTAIYKIDAESGQLLAYYKTPRPLTTSRCLTVDPSTGALYVSGTTGLIFRYNVVEDSLVFDRSFTCVDPRDGVNAEKSGLAWFRDDPDGCQLYVISYHEFPADDNSAGITIYKINVETNEIRVATTLPNVFPATAGGRCGMTITGRWNSQVWVMAAIIEQSRTDWMAILELAPNTSWISYSPKADTLEAGEVTPIDLVINSENLEIDITYTTTIEFSHNADPGTMQIPVFLHVVDTLPIVPPDTVGVDPNTLPLVFEMKPNYPNPFNPTTTMRFSLDKFGPVKLTVYDISGREVAQLLNQPMKPGRYAVSFDATSLPAGLYVSRLESGTRTAVQKMVLVK